MLSPPGGSPNRREENHREEDANNGEGELVRDVGLNRVPEAILLGVAGLISADIVTGEEEDGLQHWKEK